MPFGVKPDQDGQAIHFDDIFSTFIAPAVAATGMNCDRGDQSVGIEAVLQKGFLRLVLQSEVMIADLTTRNQNVIYELGVRFATHSHRTIIIDGSLSPLPFHLRILPRLIYRLDHGRLSEEEATIRKPDLEALIRKVLERDAVTSPIFDLFPHLRVRLPRDKCVFIGHGGSDLWRRVEKFLEKDLSLKTISYESESQVGRTITGALESMLSRASFAILALTAEDATHDLKKRARQNVIHEAGLFRGTLGFDRAILLRQKNVEEFSNVAGLQHIEFTEDNIDQTFHELERVIRREKLIISTNDENMSNESS
jgi:predicted nucleotide-binding protein